LKQILLNKMKNYIKFLLLIFFIKLLLIKTRLNYFNIKATKSKNIKKKNDENIIKELLICNR